MNNLGFIIGIMGVLFYSIIINKKRNKTTSVKEEPRKNKNWIVMEHTEGERGDTKKCYLAQHKENKIKSPCFVEVKNLNKWLIQNAN